MGKDDKNSDWFLEFKNSEEYKIFAEHPVAYFCAEYALDSSLPIYAGGLGVLAGDFVRETAQRKFPLVAVGLFYLCPNLKLSNEKEGFNFRCHRTGRQLFG